MGDVAVTVTTTGSVDALLDTTILSITNAAADGPGIALYELGHFDLFHAVNTFTPTTLTNTAAVGYDSAMHGQISITGSGFLGSSPVIYSLDFTGDDGSVISILAPPNVNPDGGLTSSTTTYGLFGNITSLTTSYLGETETISAPTSAIGFHTSAGSTSELDGMAAHQTFSFSGLTVTFDGEIDLQSGGRGFTYLSIDDGAGNSIAMTSPDEAISEYELFKPGITTVADIFANADEFSGNDVMTVADNSIAWHGFYGNDTLTGGSNADTLFGDGLSDTLIGLGGNDTLDGGTGADVLTGGDGNDTYIVDLVAVNAIAKFDDAVSESPSQGIDSIILSNALPLAKLSTLVLPNEVENLDASQTGTTKLNLTGNTSDNILIGNDAANIITGGNGHDTIDGRNGTDTMSGGLGSDTYYVDSTLDKIIEGNDPGHDVVFSSASFVLATYVEDLTLTGSANANATGNASANTLTGNAGDNRLDGGAGADSLIGGDGNDTYVLGSLADAFTEDGTVNSTGDTVVIAYAGSTTSHTDLNLSGFANIENITVTGTGLFDLTGDANNNILIGNTSGNTLTGNGSNDVFDGGAGADRMIGGGGNDTYTVDNAGDIVVDSGGTNTVIDKMPAGTYFLSSAADILILSGTGALHGTGNGNDNTITGNAGANVLDGAVGGDTMIGGAGADTYFVDNLNDVVTETTAGAAGGVDTVNSGVSFSFHTGDNLEKLTLTGSGDIDGTGNELANTITGNGGDNILDGVAGADALKGGSGDDTYKVDVAVVNGISKIEDAISDTGGNDTIILRAGDVSGSIAHWNTFTLSSTIENLDISQTDSHDAYNVTGNASANTLAGNDHGDTISGLAGADVLIGGLAADVLIGGTGQDTLTGGGGADHFVIQRGEAGTSANADLVTDFQAGPGGDALDIHSILSGFSPGSSVLSDFVHLIEASGSTIVSIDATGSPAGAFMPVATLEGVTGLSATQMVIDGNLIVA